MIINDIKQINNIKDIHKIINKVSDIEIISDNAEYFLNDKILLKNFLYILLAQQKNKIESYRTPKINIKKLFKKKLYKKNNLYKIYKKYPSLNRNLGSIPSIFLENVKDKGICSKQLFKVFSDYSLKLNYSFSDNIISIDELNKIIKNFANEISIITKSSINVSFIGNGSNGNGFKISVSNLCGTKNFFYKVFYPRKRNKFDIGYRHGSDLEPIFAYFTNCNDRKKHFVKFYAGCFSSQYEKDAFIITEFVDKNTETKKSNVLNIDFIISEDKRFDNTINGKIVDFGAIKVAIPKLLNKHLKKIVRIITSRIILKFDKTKINYNWKMSKANCNILKNYVKNVDKNIYLEALNIINKQIPTLPKSFIRDLKNINNWEEEHFIDITKAINAHNIITDNFKLLKRNIKTFDIKIKSTMEGDDNLFGYIILDLYNMRQAVYFFDKYNNITRLRIEQKKNNTFETLLELYGEEIKNYMNSNISNIFCS